MCPSLLVRALIRFSEMTNSISSVVSHAGCSRKRRRKKKERIAQSKKKQVSGGTWETLEAVCCTCKSKQQTENEREE
jgi:hypothetical protein